MEPNSIWIEVIKVSVANSTSNAQFLECLIRHTQLLINELKVLIDNTCIALSIQEIKAGDHGKEQVILDRHQCQLLGFDLAHTEDEKAIVIQDDNYLNQIKCQYPAVKTEDIPYQAEISKQVKTEDLIQDNEGLFQNWFENDPVEQTEPSLATCEEAKPLPFDTQKAQVASSSRKKDSKQERKKKLHASRSTGKFSRKYNPNYFVDEPTWYSMVDKTHPWICPKCDLEFKNLECMIIHWRKKVCIKRPGYAKYVGLKKMENSTHSEYFCKHALCSGSTEVWKYNIQVLKHWQDNHFMDVNDPVVCKVTGCGEQFVAVPLLTLHISNKHKQKEELYSCQHCGWMTQDKRSLAFHENRHKAEKTISCPFCPYRTNENRNLEEHKRRRHAAEIGYTRPEKLPHVCDACGKSFRTPSSLREHQASHSVGQNPEFRCDICGKYLKQQNSFSKHMMNVHKKGHNCEVCNKIFYSSKVLQIHRRDKHGIAATILS